MSREANPEKKRKITLELGGKRQLIEIVGFCGEADTLQEVIFFLEELGISEEEIIRLLKIGAMRYIPDSFENKKQALDQFVWLIVIQGQISDLKKRADFLIANGAQYDFLEKTIRLGLKLSCKIYKKKMTDNSIDFYTGLILHRMDNRDQSKRFKLSGPKQKQGG